MAGNAELIGQTADGRQLVRLACAIDHTKFATAEDGSTSNKLWLHIMPNGPLVVARDGRAFQVTSASAVATASELPMLLDWEHESESWDGSTEAAGWGEKLEVRDDGVWMECEFTPDGLNDVKSKKFRYLSPVLVIDGESRDVQEIISVALTNKPALRMKQIGQFRARFSERFGPLAVREDHQEQSMDKQKRALLCAAFSLAEAATDDEIVSAATKATAGVSSAKELLSTANTQVADLTRQNAALTTERDGLQTQLAAAKAEGEKATRDAKINSMFEENRKKITPAMETSLRAMFAKTPSTFDSFVEFQLPTMAEIAAPAPASAPPKTAPAPAANSKFEVTDKDRELFRKRGMSDAEIDAAVKHQAEQRARRFEAEED